MIEDEELRMNIGNLMQGDGELRIESDKLRLEDCGFEDPIMPHKNFIHILMVLLFCKSPYFEDIVHLRIFRLRTIYNFFQVFNHHTSTPLK